MAESDAKTEGTLLVRFAGDITTKAKPTRRLFMKRLVRNLKDAIDASDARAEVVRTHDRVYVEVREGNLEAAAAALARVFGVQSLARVEKRPWRSQADVVSAGVSLFADAVRGRRFAVRARRVGERARIRLDAGAVERELGAALLPEAAGVDLGNPEVWVRVELTPGSAYFHSESVRGPGGLPLGVEGRAVALVSGGFDSAVAAWQLQKRGVALDYVFCNLGGRSHQLGTLRVMKEVADRWSFGARPRFHSVDFEAVTRDLQENTQTRYWQVVLKRLMLRAAQTIALEGRAEAIVTGEAVGQVSSQTLRNLAAISSATELPILRPLVGFNKDEIIALARQIGTFELSKVVGEYCALVPRKPATAAKAAVVIAEEQRLDPALLERAVAERSIFDLRAVDLQKLDSPGLGVHAIPEGAAVIDLRTPHVYRAWHYPDALFLDFTSALRAYPSFQRDRCYVLYCEFGLKSAHLAELMRRDGFEVFHFQKGLPDLIRHAREQGIATPLDVGNGPGLQGRSE